VILNDELVRKAEVSIENSGNGVSTVRWTTIATTLNEKGNEHFEDLEGRLQFMLRVIAMSLKHYCERGHMSPRSELALAH
jgi:hypothetical protein